MKQNTNLTPSGESKSGTIETRQDLQSTNVVNPSTSGTSATTADPKSRKDSQPTPNLADVTNASRLLQALSTKLGALVEWKKLELQTLNGVLLRVILIVMLRLINDRRLMGRFKNGRLFNSVAWITVLIVIALPVVLVIVSFIPQIR